MVGGSVATSAYGEPRATHDVDLVARLPMAKAGALCESLGDDFYANSDVVRAAARRHTRFNIIHFATTEKIDVYCVGDEPFQRHGLANRRVITVPDGRSVRWRLLKIWWWRSSAGIVVGARYPPVNFAM